VPKSNFVTRFLKLMIGLFIYGVGVALTVSAKIGIAPWDVLAQGISRQTSLSFGWATVAVSVMVLLTWIPLRVRPGLGSIMNAITVGLVADWTLSWLPSWDNYLLQLFVFLIGMAVISFATGMYISVGMGKGPRDGLNVGLASALKKPFWMARSIVEITVVTIGFLLGGQVREGTLIFAIFIGYMNQIGLRIFRLVDKGGRL